MSSTLVHDPQQVDEGAEMNTGVYIHAGRAAIKNVQFSYVGKVVTEKIAGSVWIANIWNTDFFVSGCEFQGTVSRYRQRTDRENETRVSHPRVVSHVVLLRARVPLFLARVPLHPLVHGPMLSLG